MHYAILESIVCGEEQIQLKLWDEIKDGLSLIFVTSQKDSCKKGLGDGARRLLE